MDQLLTSRINKQQEVTYLDDLSPQKFGRSAYANLAYTPSKLASNVLYKEVFQMKKIQENGSKVREYEALNQILKDKLRLLQNEKEGIEQSLSQQIGMYKRMVTELQQTQEQRIKNLQTVFNEQLQKIIFDKEQEAKYVQSQKQLLQNRIFQLQDIIAQLKNEFAKRVAIYDQLSKQHEKLQIYLKNSEEKLNQVQKQLYQEKERAKTQIDSLNKKIFISQGQFRNNLQRLAMQKQRQIENLERFHRSQIQKVQARRTHELTLKNQQLKDLASTFEAESKRLNQYISKRDQQIQALNQNLSQEKQRILKITKQFTIQIGALTNEKNKIKEQCHKLNDYFQREKEQVKKTKNAQAQTKNFLQGEISKLKKEYQQTELAFRKERERLFFQNDDMRKQIAILRKHAETIKKVSDQNAFLCNEVRNLKDLLIETSVQMQRCQDQFIRLATQKQKLITKLQELDLENQALHRIILQKEEECRGWRQSYYKHRR